LDGMEQVYDECARIRRLDACVPRSKSFRLDIAPEFSGYGVDAKEWVVRRPAMLALQAVMRSWYAFPPPHLVVEPPGLECSESRQWERHRDLA
jgi:hypothetical protein